MQCKCVKLIFMANRDFNCIELIAIHLIKLHNILDYMKITIIKSEAADLVKTNT